MKLNPQFHLSRQEVSKSASTYVSQSSYEATLICPSDRVIGIATLANMTGMRWACKLEVRKTAVADQILACFPRYLYLFLVLYGIITSADGLMKNVTTLDGLRDYRHKLKVRSSVS